MNTQLLEQYILLNLKNLSYPFPIEDPSVFINSLNSPTQLRNDTIEWLFCQMEPEYLQKITQAKPDQPSRLQILFKFFGLDQTKDNILGMSTQINNMKCIYDLIRFTKKYLSIDESKEEEEITKALRLIKYVDVNKVELFKEKIRLFVTEIDKGESKEERVKIKTIQDNIETTKQLLEKLDKKLNKITSLNISYETITRDDSLELRETLIKFDKEVDIFIKNFNSLYEKEIKYISDDKIGKLHIETELFHKSYSQLQNIADTLEQIFATHNNIITYKI